MKFGVVVFPGSNCDHDAWYALGEVLHQPVEFLWHQSEQVNGFDAILLPGGFSYGDYLRTGAIARFSPVMRAVEKFARGGGWSSASATVSRSSAKRAAARRAAAQCRNAFRVPPGAHVRVETTDTPFTARPSPARCCKFRSRTATEIIFATKRRSRTGAQRQIVFRYTTPDGREEAAANPNGSLANIAGVCNRERNVVGLMPHPERAVEAPLGSSDGLVIFAR
jgi:phosphoribosylformylglycinamidine synthase I